MRSEFEELYVSADEELYPGYDYVTRLDFMTKFIYFKVKGKWTDYIFNEMLELFQNVFPTTKGYKLPPSHYAIKKTFKTIGLGYESIHACVNDCFLFRSEDHKDKQFCLVCNTSRWKDSNTPGKKVPKKVLHYFPIIPRLQRLYKSSHTTKKTTWHATRKCMKPGKMQHRLMVEHERILTPSKIAYIGHRRFLKNPHKWRRSLDFNGEIKNEDPPRKFDRDDIMAQLARLPMHVKGKHLMYGGVKIKCNVLVGLNWTERSVFYEPGYWSFLTLKHNLDVMHIEKNVLESILNTLLMNDKSKDTIKARQDLKRLGIQSGLWLGQNKNGKCTKPHAAYSFTPGDRKKFCQFIKGVKLPDGFGSNFKHKVTDNAQSKVINILCNLKLIYPPGFFDIMIHLVIHLPLEALEGGPIRPRRDERHTTQNSDICSLGEDGEINKGRVKHLVIRNNITQILENGKSFKNNQYILATRVKQCFYLEDMARRPLGWKVVEHVNNKKFSNKGVIVVEDDSDIIHVDNSSDPALTTTLNDVEITALHIDGQSNDVDATSDIIDVEEDDDIIDDEDVLPHDLADSDDEDLVNVDDDDDGMSADVARGHGVEGGGDDRPPPHESAVGCRGKGTKKPNLGGRKAGRMHTRKETRNLGLRKITDELKLSDPDVLQTSLRKIRISRSDFGLILRKWPDAEPRDSRVPVSNLDLLRYPYYGRRILARRGSTSIFTTYEEMVRLHGLGTYTDDQIMAMDVLDVLVPQFNHTSDVDELKRSNKQLQKEIDVITKTLSSDDKLFTQLQSQHESGSGSGCGAGEVDESDDDEDAGEDADS
nr:hypothetical protein [Tanacetum cinerariifolium]